MIDLAPQPVWIKGKLVAPKGWISPEVREAMRAVVAEYPLKLKGYRTAPQEGYLNQSSQPDAAPDDTPRGLIVDPFNGQR